MVNEILLRTTFSGEVQTENETEPKLRAFNIIDKVSLNVQYDLRNPRQQHYIIDVYVICDNHNNIDLLRPAQLSNCKKV